MCVGVEKEEECHVCGADWESQWAYDAQYCRPCIEQHACDPWWILAARSGAKGGEGGTVVFPNQDAVRGFVKALCEQAKEIGDE